MEKREKRDAQRTTERKMINWKNGLMESWIVGETFRKFGNINPLIH